MAARSHPATKAQASAASGRGTETGSQERSAQDPQKPFLEAHYDYVRALQKARADAHEAVVKLQRVFQETTQDEERRVQRLLGDAASELERGSREASSRENPQQLLAECERSYHQRRQELETEARRNLDRAANEHEEAVRERQKKNRQRERDAFVDYLQRLEQAWAELDPKALDAPALETIAQTLLAAAAAERQSSWSGPPGT